MSSISWEEPSETLNITLEGFFHISLLQRKLTKSLDISPAM
jgi:hypothetical protein